MMMIEANAEVTSSIQPPMAADVNAQPVNKLWTTLHPDPPNGTRRRQLIQASSHQALYRESWLRTALA